MYLWSRVTNPKSKAIKNRFYEIYTPEIHNEIFYFLLSFLTVDMNASKKKQEPVLRYLSNTLHIEKNQKIDAKVISYYKDDKNIGPDELFRLIVDANMMPHIFQKGMDLSSFLFGVLSGRYSNARKNVYGSLNEHIIQSILESNNVEYKKQDSSLMENKRFDFSFVINDQTYVLETNFFNNTGSKVISEGKRFAALQENIKQSHPELKFIYVTDGDGWKAQPQFLNEIINSVEMVFNINQFKEWIEKETSK